MLLKIAKEFFNRLNDRSDAVKWLKAYNMRIEFDVVDGKPFNVKIKDGRIVAVEPGKIKKFNIRNDLSLVGEKKYLLLIFEGRLTPATAMFYAKLTPQGERAKHNQSVIAFRLMRIAQETDLIDEL
jgi:hypothetical protein